MPSGRLALPVLTPENAREEPAWHAYYERHFHQPVSLPVQLGTWTWFYKDAPLSKDLELRAVIPQRFHTLPTGAHLVDLQCGKHAREWPECILQQSGRFASNPSARAALTAPWLEVMRTNAGAGATEEKRGEQWFYHAPGSGIFLENAGLEIRTHGGRHLTEIIRRLRDGESAADVPFKDALGRACRGSYSAAAVLGLVCEASRSEG